MLQVLEQTRTKTFPSSQTEDYMSPYYEGVCYPVEHEEKEIGETSYHIKLITNFLQILLNFFHQRDDIFLSANMNIYYEENNPFRWYAPDLLIAFGVANIERSNYILSREKIFPQVVFEVASETTRRNDVEEKLRSCVQTRKLSDKLQFVAPVDAQIPRNDEFECLTSGDKLKFVGLFKQLLGF